MHPTFLALVLALIFMDAALLVDAGLYVRVFLVFVFGFCSIRRLSRSFNLHKDPPAVVVNHVQSLGSTMARDHCYQQSVSRLLDCSRASRCVALVHPNILTFMLVTEIGAKDSPCRCYLCTFNHLQGIFQDSMFAIVLSYL